MLLWPPGKGWLMAEMFGHEVVGLSLSPAGDVQAQSSRDAAEHPSQGEGSGTCHCPGQAAPKFQGHLSAGPSSWLSNAVSFWCVHRLLFCR